MSVSVLSRCQLISIPILPPQNGQRILVAGGAQRVGGAIALDLAHGGR